MTCLCYTSPMEADDTLTCVQCSDPSLTSLGIPPRSDSCMTSSSTQEAMTSYPGAQWCQRLRPWAGIRLDSWESRIPNARIPNLMSTTVHDVILFSCITRLNPTNHIMHKLNHLHAKPFLNVFFS